MVPGVAKVVKGFPRAAKVVKGFPWAAKVVKGLPGASYFQKGGLKWKNKEWQDPRLLIVMHPFLILYPCVEGGRGGGVKGQNKKLKWQGSGKKKQKYFYKWPVWLVRR